MGGPQGRPGQMQKMSPPPEFDTWTVQPLAVAIRTKLSLCVFIVSVHRLYETSIPIILSKLPLFIAYFMFLCKIIERNECRVLAGIPERRRWEINIKMKLSEKCVKVYVLD
jgi:hypothetical protein